MYELTSLGEPVPDGAACATSDYRAHVRIPPPSPRYQRPSRREVLRPSSTPPPRPSFAWRSDPAFPCCCYAVRNVTPGDRKPYARMSTFVEACRRLSSDPATLHPLAGPPIRGPPGPSGARRGMSCQPYPSQSPPNHTSHIYPTGMHPGSPVSSREPSNSHGRPGLRLASDPTSVRLIARLWWPWQRARSMAGGVLALEPAVGFLQSARPRRVAKCTAHGCAWRPAPQYRSGRWRHLGRGFVMGDGASVWDSRRVRAHDMRLLLFEL